jgi:iron complex transport system substrate-binding protein
MSDIDRTTGLIIACAINIHRDLGPGLLESIYERILVNALRKQNCVVFTQQPVLFEYDGDIYHDAFRVDMIVNHEVVVELKSVTQMHPVYHKQLLTYLKLMHLPVGLLINFGDVTLKKGLTRVVNTYRPSDH